MCYSVHFRNLSNFIANKCTSLILLFYVTLQSRRHVSILVDHHRGIFYMNIFPVWRKKVKDVHVKDAPMMVHTDRNIVK
jgi:hypothetical protein